MRGSSALSQITPKIALETTEPDSSQFCRAKALDKALADEVPGEDSSFGLMDSAFVA